jgi:inosine-uridine nucleoside N-ribohydrolase
MKMTYHLNSTLLRPTVRRLGVLALTGLLVVSCAGNHGRPAGKPAPIPVILDADIGDDIDDTWALGLLLKSPELDLKLAVGDYGQPEYRTRLLAKFLQVAGRSDVPVGRGLEVGPPQPGGNQADWIKDYDLKAYPGKVHADGVQAMIDVIMQSKQPVTLIGIGPAPNIAEALRREPRIARRARFVGMYGSVRAAYGRGSKPEAEYNVARDPQSCQQVFTAPWDMTITPLDTCARVTLTGTNYQRLYDSHDPVATAIIANYRVWATARGQGLPAAVPQKSTTLFDTVAVYLAFSQDLCAMEKLGLRVTDDGFTVEDATAKPVKVALTWKDLAAFESLLVERLTGGK